MRKIWRKAKPKDQGKIFRLNWQIKVPEVFLIDENNVNVGVIPTAQALKMAQEAELDLVEVNPKGVPPVAKILDFGQFKYESDKKAHKQKVQQKKVDIKGIRLSLRISQHDLDFRLEQAKKFLERGDKLKIELGLRGREKQHTQKALEVMKNFVIELEKTEGLNIVREQDLTKQGGSFNIILANKAQ
jgi:translation initiation factor IF-3